MKRAENKCSNCLLWRSRRCPESRGVVIWRNCWKFKADWARIEAAAKGGRK